MTTGEEIPGTGPGPGTEAAGKHHLELDVTTGDEIPGTGPGPGTEAAGKHHLELRCQNLLTQYQHKAF